MSRQVYRVRGGCVLCVTCKTVCPVGAVTIDGDGAHIDPAVCTGCGQCAANCPAEAIEAVPHDAHPEATKGTEND